MGQPHFHIPTPRANICVLMYVICLRCLPGLAMFGEMSICEDDLFMRAGSPIAQIHMIMVVIVPSMCSFPVIDFFLKKRNSFFLENFH